MPDGVGGGVPLSLSLLPSGDRAVARRRPSSRIARRRKYSMKRAVCSSSPPSFCSASRAVTITEPKHSGSQRLTSLSRGDCYGLHNRAGVSLRQCSCRGRGGAYLQQAAGAEEEGLIGDHFAQACGVGNMAGHADACSALGAGLLGKHGPKAQAAEIVNGDCELLVKHAAPAALLAWLAQADLGL